MDVSIAAFVVSAVAVIVSVGAVFFARRSAAASVASAEEARKSRLESGGPFVTVMQVVEERRRWVLSPMMGHREYHQRELLNPIHEYVLPRDGDARIAVSCSIILRNEGSTTATVSASHDAFVQTPEDASDGNDERGGLAARSDGTYALGPSQTCVVVMRVGMTVEEWAAMNGSAQLSSAFSASNPSGSVTDDWKVKLTARVLDPVHGDAARWRELPLVPTKAEISSPFRRYTEWAS